ncbi:MAG: T9SS type A sorting domain-containing protein [Ignavibacteria bacterium]|nr:T9SS type A sorting domain-containing protein [Ignavibacteria bacterium]
MMRQTAILNIFGYSKNIFVLPVFVLILILPFFETSAQTKTEAGIPQTIKPSDIGLIIKRGKIDKLQMNRQMKDTIVFGRFNYEDDFEDVAVYYDIYKTLVIYKNNANGTMSVMKQYEYPDGINQIESIEKDHFAYSKMSDIKIINTDNTESILTSHRMNSSEEMTGKVPLRNILDDSRVFQYDASAISFTRMWESWRSGQAHRGSTIGDIDNDGKIEMIYTFYPVSDSIPLYKPTRIVIFENVTPTTYRIDWDTISQIGAWNHQKEIFDFDRNGKKEFLSTGPSLVNPNALYEGMYECQGPGVYKFYRAAYSYHAVRNLYLKDSVYINGEEKPEVWVGYVPGETSTYISRYRFKQKSSLFYEFVQQMYCQTPGYVYFTCPGDIDRDGKDEILLGASQWETNFIEYLDSTGGTPSAWGGYSVKEFIPNAPLCAGFGFMKDYDADGYPEITTAGIGNGSGSLGVIKHSGQPGENVFTTMWWTTENLFSSPNLGVDTGWIDDNFTVLYPNIKPINPPIGNPISGTEVHIFKRNNLFSFNKIYFQYFDSLSFLMAKFGYPDNDNKISILTPLGKWTPTGQAGEFHYTNYKQFGTVNIQVNNTIVPENFILHQNYPNPFNPETKIKYEIKNKSEVKLIVFDITGKTIEELADGIKNPGIYETRFESKNLPSGVYFYSLIINGLKTETKKMILIK